MKTSRITALFLTLALAWSLAAPAEAYSAASLIPQKKTYTTAFTDTTGTWCDSYVRTCYEAGLLDGTSKTTFSPSAPLTYAQITVITARLHELLHGGDGVLPASAAGQAWYQSAADYLAAQVDASTPCGSYLQGCLTYLADCAGDSCDRYDFVWFLSAVLPEGKLAAINAVTALPDTSDTDILAFYNAGILTGSDEYGTFNGLDALNRGQAAAMLARLADPSQRVKFTLKTLVMSQAVLGLAPETAMLTIDGYTINAETYAYTLTSSILSMEMEASYDYYDTYETYFTDYLSDDTFDGSFADYLLEKYNIDVNTAIDWNAPDKGGLTPAQKVQADTLAVCQQLAVLMNHQSSYPITAAQNAAIAEYLPYFQEYGYSTDMARLQLTSEALLENLTEKHTMSAEELSRYLEESGYLYGQYIALYRGEYASGSDTEIREVAETARREIATHLNEPDYIEYLIWKYSDEYASLPDLIPLSDFSSANQTTLKNLGTGKVSAVLTEEDRYLVVLKLDPSNNDYVSQLGASIPAMAQLDAWSAAAQVTPSAAYNRVDIAKAAAAYDSLEIW